MENKNAKSALLALMLLSDLALILVAISVFLSVINIKFNYPMAGAMGVTIGGPVNLFSDIWDMCKVSPAFIAISFVVLLIGLMLMVIDSAIKLKLQKKAKGLNYAALAIVVIGLALVITSVLIAKDQLKNEYGKMWLAIMKESGQTNGMSDEMLKLGIGMLFSYKLDVGTIMAIIGGIIALVSGILLVIPVFDPTQEAKSPSTATATTYAQPAANKDNVGGGLASVKPFDPQYANTDADAANNDGNADE